MNKLIKDFEKDKKGYKGRAHEQVRYYEQETSSSSSSKGRSSKGKGKIVHGTVQPLPPKKPTIKGPKAGYIPSVVRKEFQLLEGGSEILGTTAYWSDMDILCILPKYINIYDFIEEDASDFDIMDNEIIEWNKNARSILALADRLIYSNIAGYLSGHSLSIMSANICIEFPEATSLSFFIEQFFNLYNSWEWGEKPLFLVDLIDTNKVFEHASTIVEPWRWVKNDDSSSETGSSEKRGTKNEGNDGAQMSIITPGFPEQNTTFNVPKLYNNILNKNQHIDGLIPCKLWIVGVNLNSATINNLAMQGIDIDIGQILTIDGDI
uniref:polynucleotide adenylyltransferase n=1 Tax=Meloidogyne javanica TaxID=6303 RepID=A0A915M291_MELJA